MTPTRLDRLRQAWQPGASWWIPAVVIASLIFWLSSLPADVVFAPGPHEGWVNIVFKKTAHVVMYGLLAVAMHRAFKLRANSWRWAFLFASLYGLTDEWHQSFVPGREATLRDVIFDLSGAGLGLRVQVVLARSPLLGSAALANTALGR